mgnify:CR=1 FL=1
MNEKDVKKAIKDGVENAAAAVISEEIANAIMSSELQNEEFISEKSIDKVHNAQINEISDGERNASESGRGKKEKEEQNLGKFKNPQELLRAYGELEKEFTRKSQRLKELESVASENCEFSEEKWKEAADKFFEKTPTAKPFVREIASKIMEEPSLKNDNNCFNVALTKVLLDKFRTPEQLMQDGQFLNDYVLSSDKVKSAVIEEYLRTIRAGQPPKTLADDGLACVSLARKPKTVEEAGIMFLKNNE